jgi:pimeloyl-ACP methyl ester carboxylesterase/DNA-binding winged helix-turn-helix (wHTH) protein
MAHREGHPVGAGTLVFDDCELDVARLELRRSGSTIHVEPQVFDVLAYLIEHRDRVVTKAELLEQVWGDRFVSESALTSRLKAVRRAVGDDGIAQRVIRTVHGRGYQFVAAVAQHARPRHAPDPSPARQQIRFCVAPDGVRIAYATSGSGPHVVKAANWMSHLDHDWESPIWRHWLLALAGQRTLVRYDERGCGLSDWDVERFGFDAWVEDLEMVVEAAGLGRFPLVGLSQGGAVAIAYAVRHPERVSRLVLVGAYARGRLVRARDDEERREAALDLEVARVGWRREDDVFRQVFSTQFLPDASVEQWRAFNELQRRTASADNAVRFLEEFARIDVTDRAPLVRCPTLIVHARGDLRVPLSCARELAALVPDSRLVTLSSRNHILTASEPAWPVLVDEIGRFLTDDRDD